MPSKQPSRFSLLDAKIKRSLIEAGEALAEIRDEKLFAEGGFKSFRDYCDSIGKSYQWAWLQIKAAEVAKELPAVTNEAQAREVRKIAVPQRKKAVQEAIKQSGGTLTAPAIQRATNRPPERKSESAQKLPEQKKAYDETGAEIPPEIQQFWNRNEEVQHLLSMLSKVRVTLEKAAETGDRLFKKVDLTGSIANLQRVKEEVECAKSYAVCPQCSGIMFEDCSQCQGRGSLSKFHWSMVPGEIQKLRENKH
jgi:hypothetical protein